MTQACLKYPVSSRVLQGCLRTSTAASASIRVNCSVRGSGSWLAPRVSDVCVQLGLADAGDAASFTAGFTASMIACVALALFLAQPSSSQNTWEAQFAT